MEYSASALQYLPLDEYMHTNGLDQLRHHIPDITTPLGLLRLFWLPITLIFLISVLFNILSDTPPICQLAAVILLGCLEFGLMIRFFRSRQDF